MSLMVVLPLHLAPQISQVRVACWLPEALSSKLPQSVQKTSDPMTDIALYKILGRAANAWSWRVFGAVEVCARIPDCSKSSGLRFAAA